MIKQKTFACLHNFFLVWCYFKVVVLGVGGRVNCPMTERLAVQFLNSFGFLSKTLNSGYCESAGTHDIQCKSAAHFHKMFLPSQTQSQHSANTSVLHCTVLCHPVHDWDPEPVWRLWPSVQLHGCDLQHKGHEWQAQSKLLSPYVVSLVVYVNLHPPTPPASHATSPPGFWRCAINSQLTVATATANEA